MVREPPPVYRQKLSWGKEKEEEEEEEGGEKGESGMQPRRPGHRVQRPKAKWECLVSVPAWKEASDPKEYVKLKLSKAELL